MANKNTLSDDAIASPSVLCSSNPGLYEKLEYAAIDMRKNPTVAERLLWEKLRNKQLGIKFRQQHVIEKFIVDFCSIKSSLIIEVDGNIHDDQKEYDEDRTRILESQGYTVIRFKNVEVLKDIDDVLLRINAALKSPPAP
ncbi:MAG: endonuclease domain-containing protein [Spirochaetaceae bacterium]|nr:endonuclease domain-containing protein [Spirochaetaceae bacterium]